jgi:hypothetical protein
MSMLDIITEFAAYTPFNGLKSMFRRFKNETGTQ